MNKRFKIEWLIILSGVMMAASCNITKLVPEGDALYTGATIKVEDSILSKKEKKNIISQTEGLTRPKPNSKFLGIPFKLILYNMGGDLEKGGFIRKFFRKAGQPPVLASTLNLDYNEKVLDSYLENVGYFLTEVSGDTVVKKKKTQATYTITPGPVYTIKEVNYEMDSSALGIAINNTKAQSILHPGDPFNLEVIKGERTRIDAILKENGYYFF